VAFEAFGRPGVEPGPLELRLEGLGRPGVGPGVEKAAKGGIKTRPMSKEWLVTGLAC
jgi:hypothetical protein